MSSDTAVARRGPYADRVEAGDELAEALREYADREDVVVLGLPRGGVPVAARVARALHAPLDVFMVRKLGVPGQRELAMGAIASGGIQVLNPDVVRWIGISQGTIEGVARQESIELARRELLYRDGRPPLVLTGRTVIIVDDGLATGSTMRAAVQAVRTRKPARIVVAVPVGSREACHDLGSIADDVVCPLVPVSLQAIGQWYYDFAQTSDDKVRALLGLPVVARMTEAV